MGRVFGTASEGLEAVDAGYPWRCSFVVDAGRPGASGAVRVHLFLICAVVLWGGYMGLVRWLLRWKEASSRGLHEELTAVERSVRDLSEEEARTQAERLLADPSRYRCTEIPVKAADHGNMSHLPAAIRAFFERYEVVQGARGETKLSRSAIGPSEHHAEYTRIGTDIESTEILVDHEGRVFELEPGQQVETATRYPSLYHWLLIITAVHHPR